MTANVSTALIPPVVATPIAAVDLLLRDRAAYLDHLEEGRDVRSLVRALVMTILFGCAVFGASIGAYRGGIQLLFAATKLPLVVLLTAGVTAPALAGAIAALGGAFDLKRDILLVLSALALTAMVMAATAPVVLLAALANVDYHRAILLIVGCCASGAAFGLALFVRGLLRRGDGLRLAVPVALLVFAAVGGQMAWTFRPFVVRPTAKTVPFVRAIEGGFYDSVHRSIDSARGVYHREDPDAHP